MPKSLFKSKTVWFNLLTILIALATYAGYTPNQELAQNVATGLIMVSPVINILLRWVTKQPIE